MRILFLAATLVALASCAEEPSPEEQAAADAEAVREVEHASEPPAVMIDLQPMDFSDVEREDMFGVGCSFVPDGGTSDPVAVALLEAGYVKIDGEIEPFAPDIGSAETPFGTKTRFTSGRRVMEWTVLENEGEQSGIETVDYRATVRLLDGRDGVVYERAGTAQCGS